MQSVANLNQQKEICIEIGSLPLRIQSSIETITILKTIWKNFLSHNKPILQLTIQEDTTKKVVTDYSSAEDKDDIHITENEIVFNSTYCTGTFHLKNKKGTICIPPLKEQNMFPVKAALVVIWGHYLLLEGKILLHGCGLKKNNKTYLFLGKPGAGKTTIAQKNSDAVVLGDECVGLEKTTKGNSYLFATPIPGEIKNISNTKEHLNEVLSLEKNQPLKKEPMTKKQLFYTLVENNMLFMVLDKRSTDTFKKILAVTKPFSETLKSSKLFSKKEDDIWQVIT